MKKILLLSSCVILLTNCNSNVNSTSNTSQINNSNITTEPSAGEDITQNTFTIKLPDNIEESKYNMSVAFKMAKMYPSKFVKQVNSNKQRLHTIKLPFKIEEINGEKRILLSNNFMRAGHFFKELNFYGTGLRSIKSTWESTKDDRKGNVSILWGDDEKLMLRPKTITVKNKNYDGYYLVLNGNAHVDYVELNDPNGLNPVFDESAWGIIGMDKPIYNSKVNIDLTKKRAIAGVTEFQRNKFNRVYATPFSTDHKVAVTEGYESEKEYTKLGFLPGRQMVKFSFLNEDATQDPNRPGYGDPEYFKNWFKKDPVRIKYYKDLYGDKKIQYVQCFDNYPKWMDLKVGGNDRGTPDQKYFDQAADYSAQYIDGLMRQTGGILPHWIEVKNESSIPNEWTYHNVKDADSWKLLADLHNKVATAIKQNHPDIKVGGPTSAFMALDANNFEQAKQQLRFMDFTKDNLDFYSHHFYEGGQLVLQNAKDQEGGFLTGRLLADMDLIESHMSNTNNVKPIVVSETGTLIGADSSDVQQWLKLKNYNSYMLQYINQQNKLDIVVPFILPIMWWNKDVKDTIYQYDKTKNHISSTPTSQVKYLQFWKDYDGTLIPVTAENKDLHIHAVTKGKKVYVAINNLSNQRAFVDLNINLGDNKVTNIQRHRMFLNKGKLFDVNEKIKDISKVPFAVEETSIVEIDLQNPINFQGTLNELSFYGDKTLQPTGEMDNFTVNTSLEKINSSKLRVDFGKKNGFNSTLQVNVNGHVFNKDISNTENRGNFFGYVEFKIPTDILKETNQITTLIPQTGGKVSSVVLTNKYNS